MQVIELITLIAVLIILAEVTYLATRVPATMSNNKKQVRSVLIDTSVLIDGRITTVAKTKFIGGILVIPRSVIGELQFLADNADHEKRARARSGLDVVSELQNMPGVEVEIFQDGSKAEEGVDERLLNLAKKHNAAICTIDYNLNKVATVENIEVLNINELAQSVRMSYLPGEKLTIDLVQKGQDQHQGVGYLPDGTMVVVEHASNMIGQPVEVEFIRSLQTAAGRMMFARRLDAMSQNKRQQEGRTVASSTQSSAGRRDRPQSRSEAPREKFSAPHGKHRPGNPTSNAKSAQPARQGQASKEDHLIHMINNK